MFEVAKSMTVPFLIIALIFIFAEITLSKHKKLSLYRVKDSLCNFLILVVARLSQPIFIGYVYASLKGLEHFQLFSIVESPLTTVTAFIFTDFIYYWEHRTSHTLLPLWFFHEVHHSSKDFNFTTSFRLHWLNRLTAPVLFAPLILIGFKAEQLVLFFTINLFYQFFLHTQLVDKLGLMEGIFNTPSAHRVHHAKNAIYIDKNFGGVLMLWDRLFGTYQPETETPEYGILGNFESNNPFTVQFHNLPGFKYATSRLRTQLQYLKQLKPTTLLTTLMALAFVYTTTVQIPASAEPDVPVHQTKSNKPLEGRVQMQEETNQNLLIGLWKGTVIEYHRHPTMTIESQHGTELQGIYKGLIGKFPLTGVYDQNTGAIRIFVDFSKWKIIRLRGVKEGIAILEGKVNGDTITGTANIPDLGDRVVHFEATRSGMAHRNHGNNEMQPIETAALK